MKNKVLITYASRTGFTGISVMMGVWKEGDHRDWKAIQKWSADLKKILV